MSQPWMPLYVGDYIADTAHLSCAESGAYLHLIMHYWRAGSLPDNDATLARIAKMKPAEWRRARSVIEAFFHPGWKHKRIEFELTEAARISEAGRKGGVASGEARRAKSKAKSNDRSTIDERSANDPPTKREALHSPSQRKEDSEAKASAADAAPEPVDEEPKAKLFRIGKTILVSFGVAEKRTGSLIGQWLKRTDPAGLLAAIQYARDQNVADPVAYVSTLVHSEKSNGRGQQPSLGDTARELAEQARHLEREAGLLGSDAAVGRH